MYKTVSQTIRQHDMLTGVYGVVVGLSGGVDSVTLLHVLMSLQDEFNFDLYAVHVNHNLRGQSSKEDENFVIRLCQSWDVPLQVYQADVKAHAAAHKQSIEEAGRSLRYHYLKQGMEHFGANKIAVGHHQDDNAETVLLNLFRGTGLKGLCGIPPVNGPVIRPLLDVSRQSIEAYANKHNLAYVTDATNANLDHSRNYVRNQIIPAIRRQFGRNVTAAMARSASLLIPDEEYLSAAAAELHEPMSELPEPSTPNPETCILEVRPLFEHPALSTRIIRQAIKNLRGDNKLRNITAAHIQAVLDLTKGRIGREAHLPGIKARCEYAHIILSKTNPPAPVGDAVLCIPQTSAEIHHLKPNTSISFQNLTVTLTLRPPQNSSKKQPQSHYTQSFNYDNVTGSIVLRTRRPGDKIALEGLGTKKLQDYFIDTKTPRRCRDALLLLADGSNILWIMDRHNRLSAAYKPKEGQQTCWVTIQYNQEGNGQ